MPRVAAVFSDTVQNVTFRDDAPSELVAPYTIYPSAGIFTWLTNNHVDSLILFVPEEMLTWEESDCWKLIKQLQCLPVDVDCIFGEIRKSWISNDVFLIGNYLATRLGTRPLSTLDLLKKRMLDIVISVFLLPFVLTLTAIVAILIKVDSPGPIFFRQPRQGFKGQEFNILKFRTMYERSNAITEFEQAQKNDPRTTRVGKWLRRTSIDELPQIFNVLRGDMTLVGPRPHAIQHDVYYRKLISDYAARHRIKPGITGWAQVNGLRGPTSDVTMRQRIELDLYYVDNWSIMFDLKILLSTVRAVFRADAF